MSRLPSFASSSSCLMRSYWSSARARTFGSDDDRSFATSASASSNASIAITISVFSRSLKTREIMRQSCTSAV